MEEAILSTLSPENIDCIFSKVIFKNGAEIHFLYIQLIEEATSYMELCCCLANWVILNYRKELLHEILNGEFDKLTSAEHNAVLELAQEKINNTFLDNEYAYIVKKISSYLKNNDLLNIEGFLKFWVFEYRRMLKLLLCEAVEDFYAEQEYYEFTELLKYYIQMCDSSVDLIHIVADSENKFTFYDFSKKEVYFEINEDESVKGLFSEEDKILSILITIAPKRIIWHDETKSSDSQIKNTIKEIFKNRFCECRGCDLCKK